MLRKHVSLIIATCLIALVATACLVRSSRPTSRRGQPVYVEKQKKQKKYKHKKVKHKKHRKNR